MICSEPALEQGKMIRPCSSHKKETYELSPYAHQVCAQVTRPWAVLESQTCTWGHCVSEERPGSRGAWASRIFAVPFTNAGKRTNAYSDVPSSGSAWLMGRCDSIGWLCGSRKSCIMSASDGRCATQCMTWLISLTEISLTTPKSSIAHCLACSQPRHNGVPVQEAPGSPR